MRKSHLLSVFLLFLLLPASITRAQTVHLTGTVSMEQDYRTVNFNSVQGNVNVVLPGVLSYPGQGTVMLSGTVTAKPAGRTQKEKDNNLLALQKMVLQLGQNTIPVLAGQNPFDFSLPANFTTPVPIDMVDPGGNRATVTLINPVVSTPPSPGHLPPDRPALFTDQKVFITNGNIPVYATNNNSALFQPTDKFFLKNANGQTVEAIKMAQSPTQTVLALPAGFQGGATTITRQAADRTDQTNVRIVDLTMTSPNRNLRNGQTSSITVTIDPKITDKDSAQAMQIPIMSLDVRNLTPNVVTMSGGNMQVMTFPTKTNTEPLPDHGGWQTTRTITGVTPGNFNISATLYSSVSVSTSIASAQLQSLKTAEQFNTWVKAVKQYLMVLRSQTNDGVTQTSISNAMNSLPTCNTEDMMDICKTMAAACLRNFTIPDQNLALAGVPAFAAYEAASTNLVNGSTTNPGHVHTDIIEGGLNYIQWQATTVKNPELTQAITSVENANNMLGKNYTTQNVSTLRDALQKLNNTGFVNELLRNNLPGTR